VLARDLRIICSGFGTNPGFVEVFQVLVLNFHFAYRWWRIPVIEVLRYGQYGCALITCPPQAAVHQPHGKPARAGDVVTMHAPFPATKTRCWRSAAISSYHSAVTDDAFKLLEVPKERYSRTVSHLALLPVNSISDYDLSVRIRPVDGSGKTMRSK
jgi:hypothetical protein